MIEYILQSNNYLRAWCRIGLLGMCSLAATSGLADTENHAETHHHPMRFDHVTMDDGLSQSAVLSIHQDSQGFMWFGTENGLNRYDGYEFEQYMRERGNPGSLRNDFIFALDEDDAGRIWVATNGGGLAVFDRQNETFRSFRHDPADPASLAGNVVRALLIDSEGGVWLGMREAGLDRYDPETGKFVHYDLGAAANGSAPSVFVLSEDAEGALWVGSEQGLYRVDRASGSAEAFRHDSADAGTLSQDRIRAIHEDTAGNLWIGTYGGGLNRFDRDGGTFTHFRHDPEDATSLSSDRVTAILEDSDQRLWIGTSRGLNLLDVQSGEFTRYGKQASDSSSLGGDMVASLYEDRSGILWVGTLTGGVSKWNPRTWGLGLTDAREFATGEESQPSVTAFATDGSDSVWIGTFGDGLRVLNRADDSVREFRHDPNNPNSISDDRVMSLLFDGAGNLWIGTMTGGLNRLDTASGENTVYRHDPDDASSLGANGVMTAFEDSRGRIWVGTFGGGISAYDPKADAFTNYVADPSNPASLSSDRVTSFAEDPTGRIWVGTDAGGLNLFDPSKGSFHSFRFDAEDPQSLSDDTVYSLHVDANGTVWVGTRGGGLDRVVGSADEPGSIRFENLSQQDGLANDVIYGIHSTAAGELWLSTNYGISRVDPRTGDIKNLHRRDGLQSEEFNFGAHHQALSGELFFGGNNGFNSFDPAELQTNRVAPPVILTGFFNSNDRARSDLPVDTEEGIEISWRDDNVSFEFAALDYTSPEHNRYMYKLEGFDEEWIDLGNRRRVTYTDLDDGSYLLRVKAANADGVWNEAGFSLPVRVTPAPWDTWWAYLGYVATAVQLALFLWLGHVRKLRREEEYSYRLEREVQDRTAELARRNEELKELNQSLQESSLSDPLTGLRNRRFVFEEVSRDLATISRKYTGEKHGLDPRDAADLVFMMIDLDNFKPINDTYGHAAGDQMLLEIRDVLLSTCRRSDFVIRWGGDEFVVIAKQAHAGESEALAERIRREIAERSFTLPDGQMVRTTCSIGFVAFPLFRNQAESANLDDVINLADNLMYEAKRQRNAWVGMLGINEAVTSEGFETESIEPSSLLFRARREGRLLRHVSDEQAATAQALLESSA